MTTKIKRNMQNLIIQKISRIISNHLTVSKSLELIANYTMLTNQVVLNPGLNVTWLGLLSNNSYSGIEALRKEFKFEIIHCLLFHREAVCSCHATVFTFLSTWLAMKRKGSSIFHVCLRDISFHLFSMLKSVNFFFLTFTFLWHKY